MPRRIPCRHAKHQKTLWKCAWETLEPRQLLSSVPSPVAVPVSAVVPTIGSVPAGNTSPIGFSAADIRSAYGVSSIKFGSTTGDGTGQTIAIIAADDNPDLVDSTSSSFSSSDLHKFDVAMGLVDPPSFTKVSQTGGTSYPAADPGWANEESLDVEWTHAMAPKANIILVEAFSASLTDLINGAVNWAREQASVSVISMSFATTEFSGEQMYDSYFTTPSGHQGITFVAASGDAGSPGAYPAYSSNVVAVGSTSLTLNGSTYSSETGNSSSGGGISSYETKPAYQYGVTQSSTMRTIPDVSFDGNPNTGVDVYDIYNGGSAPWYKVGGTSLGTPAWAGLIAVADQGHAQAGLGTLNGLTQTLPRLYMLNSSAFHDITGGSNGGYTAGTGYDLVTGRGTPVANTLIPDLAGGNTVTGTVFNDANGNGKLDSGESGFSGKSILLDLYGSGTDKGLDVEVTTNSSGVYKFTDLPGGTFNFTEAVPSGYKKTTSLPFSVSLGFDTVYSAKNIGFESNSGSSATYNGSISGYVFDDANGDGKFESTEKVLAGVTVYIDTNNDGKLDSGDITATSNSSGEYTFSGLKDGTYVVREVLPSGKKLTTPASGYIQITISNGFKSTSKNFGDK